MFEGEEELFGETIDLFNMADQLILPSRQMEARLRAQGLSVPSVLIQECWDRPSSFELPEPAFSRDIRFSGSPSRFPFVRDWTGRSMLHVYADERPEDAGPTVASEGLKTPQQLLSCLAEGGFGLVWPGGSESYYRMINPYKLGDFLTAGIPILVQKDLSCAEFVETHGIGFAAGSLEEADRIVQECSPSEYQELLDRMRGIRDLSRGGFFTRKVLTDAVVQILGG